MRFGIIYYGTDPKNRGLDQLCQSLITIGHSPFIVTRMPKKGEEIKENNGIPVVQLPKKYKHFHSFFSSPIPINPIWKNGIARLAEKHKWDGIFIRESPFSWPGIKVGKLLNIPVFLDIRENLGAAYVSNKTKRTALIRTIKKIIIRQYERTFLPKFDHIIPSTRELGAWIVNEYGVSKEKISVLGNYPSKRFLENAENAIKKRKKRKDYTVLRLIHTGYVLKNRGLQTIFPALKLFKEKGYDFIFKIIGEGPYLGELKKLSKQNNIERNIKFIPFLPPDEVAEALVQCDIGICSYLLNEQTHQTLPGKLFEYMAVGLPVMSSARRTVVNIIDKEECGYIYKSQNPENISNILVKLAINKKERISMGERGHKAILERYNGEVNLNILDNMLNKYVRKKKAIDNTILLMI